MRPLDLFEFIISFFFKLFSAIDSAISQFEDAIKQMVATSLGVHHIVISLCLFLLAVIVLVCTAISKAKTR